MLAEPVAFPLERLVGSGSDDGLVRVARGAHVAASKPCCLVQFGLPSTKPGPTWVSFHAGSFSTFCVIQRVSFG